MVENMVLVLEKIIAVGLMVTAQLALIIWLLF